MKTLNEIDKPFTWECKSCGRKTLVGHDIDPNELKQSAIDDINELDNKFLDFIKDANQKEELVGVVIIAGIENRGTRKYIKKKFGIKESDLK